MSMRERLVDWSKGDRLHHFWRLYRLRSRARHKLTRDFWTFLLNRSAQRHGGYVGPGAVILEPPLLPHGLHGVFISRYAVLGPDCCIYQNVTIGEVAGRAPVIGPRCLIGAGAVLIGGIQIGSDVKIGAGAVVCQDIPDGATVVSQPPRVLLRQSADHATDTDGSHCPGLGLP